MSSEADIQARGPAGSRSPEEASILYSAYRDFDLQVLAEVRRATYGEDIGQFSWITADELRSFLRRLALTDHAHVLDVACGSGGPALFIADTLGGSVTGVDINDAGITAANQLAERRGMRHRATFLRADARHPLPLPAATFDAVICIDAINHLCDRTSVYADWHRVLRPGGRILLTDAVVVTGPLRRTEILARSTAMGEFIFTPLGIHDRLIAAAGFTDLAIEDVTGTIAAVSQRWRQARTDRAAELRAIEGDVGFEDLQHMLDAAHTLASERRLSRFAYLARKPL